MLSWPCIAASADRLEVPISFTPATTASTSTRQPSPLDPWGWTAQRARDFAEHANAGLLPGRVITEHRTHYQVITPLGEISAELTGRLRADADLRSDLPGVGDFVAVRPSAGDGPATLEAVLPRSSSLIRKAACEERPQLIAANIDIVFIVMALDNDFNVERMVRYLALVREGGANPVIVLNKADIADNLKARLNQITAITADVPVHAMSARQPSDIANLEHYFANTATVALVGSSGVGKSTITNQLLGRAAQLTQTVRGYDQRGRHTTTHRELFARPHGGMIIDMPGMRGLEAWEGEGAATPPEPNFDDIETLAAQCRFRDCRHDREPGCAVTAAIKRGEIEQSRLAQYVSANRAPKRGGR
jgi:ribosome biogenesis GTPase / thiamine phosphate phosphatase